MSRSRYVVSAFLPLVLPALMASPGAGQYPKRPRGFRGMVESQPARAGEAYRSSPVNQFVATCSQRLEGGGDRIRVYAARRAVDLPDYTELLIATPVNRRASLEQLVKKSVGVVRSQTKSDQWDIYSDVFGPAGDELTLAENVFIVRRVLISSREHPIEVRFDGTLRRLKPGEILLVLG